MMFAPPQRTTSQKLLPSACHLTSGLDASLIFQFLFRDIWLTEWRWQGQVVAGEAEGEKDLSSPRLSQQCADFQMPSFQTAEYVLTVMA